LARGCVGGDSSPKGSQRDTKNGNKSQTKTKKWPGLLGRRIQNPRRERGTPASSGWKRARLRELPVRTGEEGGPDTEENQEERAPKSGVTSSLKKTSGGAPGSYQERRKISGRWRGKEGTTATQLGSRMNELGT